MRTWSTGTVEEVHPDGTARNLEQVANYCMLRTIQPPRLSGVGNESGLRGKGLVWLVGAVVYWL